MLFALSDEMIFPDPLLAEPNGLLAIGGDLSSERLLLAYSMGIFPWFNPGDEILWWASPFRPIYIPGQIKISKSLRKTINKGAYIIKLDTDFEGVIAHCAQVERKGEKGSWISPEIIAAYKTLFQAGFLHTVEVYLQDQLVGGLYGIALGRAFFGESMFYLSPNASKIALFSLSEFLKLKQFHFIDSQVSNLHSFNMGAHEVSRTVFDTMVMKATKYPDDLGPWHSPFSHPKDFLRIVQT